MDTQYLQLDSLINRAYNKLKSLQTSETRKTFCKPEIVNHNRKSYIINFIKFCDSINRTPEHVQKFINVDMSASTSIVSENNMNDDKSGLKFNNIYKTMIIMTSITNYMKEYVLCQLCKSGNTEFKKIDKNNYLCCNNCKANKVIQ